MFVLLCYFAFAKNAFRDEERGKSCFAVSDSETPQPNGDDDFSLKSLRLIKWGAVVHGASMVSCLAMAVRVSVKKECSRVLILCAFILVDFAYLAWFICLHVIRLNHTGLVCSGTYADTQD